MTTGTTMPTLAQEREQIRDQRSEYGDAWAASAYADVAERAIDRLAAAERVVEAARTYWNEDASYSDGNGKADPVQALSDMIDAIESYDATTGSAE